MWAFVRRRLGRIGACAAEDFGRAFVEVFVICASAFLPLWAGLGFFLLTKIEHAAKIYGRTFMESGDILLISCAIIGPLIYILTRRYGNLPAPLTLRFPYSIGFSLIILLIWFIAGGVFVIEKGGAFYPAVASIFDDNAMIDLSAVIGISTISILYFATVLRNYMERVDPASLMHDDQERFLRDFRNG